MTRAKIRKLVGCSNPAITVTLKKILEFRKKGKPEEEWKLTEQQWQIYQMFQFEDKFLNEIFPSEYHRYLCQKAADKANARESYIKDYALTCLKYSDFLMRKLNQKEEGLAGTLTRIRKPSTIRQMIEALEYDEDFGFKIVTERFYINRKGSRIKSNEFSRYKPKQMIEVFPYLDVCQKALDHTKDCEKNEFIHDCMDLTRLIIARGVKR